MTTQPATRHPARERILRHAVERSCSDRAYWTISLAFERQMVEPEPSQVRKCETALRLARHRQARALRLLVRCDYTGKERRERDEDAAITRTNATSIGDREPVGWDGVR